MVSLTASSENETEVSFFDRQDYEEFKLDPQVSGQTFLSTCVIHHHADKVGCMTEN
jgi:hypothetical protein